MTAFLTRNKMVVRPRLPDGIRIYAMSDIHGCAGLLQKMFTVIDNDMAALGRIRPIHVFLGDYVDRGPASRETIDLLIDRGRTHESVFLKGNHEVFLLEVLQDPSRFAQWKQFGGLQTLSSYGLAPSINPSKIEEEELLSELARNMPADHRQFLNTLRLSFVCGDFLFVHAGVRPGVPLKSQNEEDLIWIRDEFLQSTESFEKYIVHGHSPVVSPDIKPNRINIDTGAYATGNLTLLTIQGDSMLAL